jgi:hypothetical protein
MVKINHRQEFNSDDVKQTLGVASEKLAAYKEAAEFLGSKRYTVDSLKNYFNDVFPSMSQNKDSEEKVSRQAKRALEVVEAQPGAKYAAGSYWQCFNAVTYMIDHELGRTEDNRMTSAWFGENRKKKVKALDKAVEYANVA